jgi:hypothetical protein
VNVIDGNLSLLPRLCARDLTERRCERVRRLAGADAAEIVDVEQVE